jgi:DNA-binding MarR family transcriptional regulator
MLALRELGQASVKDLAHRESVTHSTMSRVVSALVTDGLLAQSESAVDGRATLVSLTRRGESQLKDTVRHALGPLQRAIEALPARKAACLETVVDLVESLIESLSSELRAQRNSR